LKKGDIIIASVINKSVSGITVKVLGTDGEGAKCVADLSVKVWELVFIVSLICML
jgi:exosome complex RNA-binding protein Csl4